MNFLCKCKKQCLGSDFFMLYGKENIRYWDKVGK